MTLGEFLVLTPRNHKCWSRYRKVNVMALMNPFEIDVSARITAHGFLLQQFFSYWFLNDPKARAIVPKEFTDVFRYHSRVPESLPQDRIEDFELIHDKTIAAMEQFFAEVEDRVSYEEAKKSAENAGSAESKAP